MRLSAGLEVGRRYVTCAFTMRGMAGLSIVLIMATGKLDRALVKSLSNQPQHDVYVIAHQDDWQLFMGDIVVEGLRSTRTATFVYLTAGDDGRDSIYWRTREQAALASTRIAIGNPSISDRPVCAAALVHRHVIRRCVLDRTESYFLRLPDGKRDGAGYASYGNQSMRRLRSRKISTITAVDGSAAYSGWADLVASVAEILGETGDAGSIIHTTDPSVALNPHDHFDHRMAGLLIDELRMHRSSNVRYYEGYALATRAANRTNVQAREKTEVFLAYDQEMTRVNNKWSAYREHPSFYSGCMLRTYARTPRMR